MIFPPHYTFSSAVDTTPPDPDPSGSLSVSGLTVSVVLDNSGEAGSTRKLMYRVRGSEDDWTLLDSTTTVTAGQTLSGTLTAGSWELWLVDEDASGNETRNGSLFFVDLFASSAVSADKVRIQNRLLAMAQTANSFYPVSYNASTGVATKGSTAVSPADVRADEIRSDFDESPVRRTSFSREKTVWTFELRVAFHEIVTAEDFEQTWSHSPSIIAREPGNNRQIRLFLRQTYPEHPPQQDAESGSRFRFVFEAQLSPV